MPSPSSNKKRTVALPAIKKNSSNGRSHSGASEMEMTLQETGWSSLGLRPYVVPLSRRIE